MNTLTRPEICLQFLLLILHLIDKNLILMGNVEPKLCWAKTEWGSIPHPFFTMVECVTIALLGFTKLSLFRILELFLNGCNNFSNAFLMYHFVYEHIQVYSYPDCYVDVADYKS